MFTPKKDLKNVQISATPECTTMGILSNNMSDFFSSAARQQHAKAGWKEAALFPLQEGFPQQVRV